MSYCEKGNGSERHELSMVASVAFRIILGFLIGGIIFGLFFSFSIWIVCVVCAMAIAFLVASTPRWGVVMLAATVMSMCSWWYSARVVARWQALSLSETILTRAEVIREVVTKERSQQVALRSIECDGGMCPQELVLGVFSLSSEVEMGDILNLSCPMERPERFAPEFDYPMFLAKDGIGFVCRFPRDWKVDGQTENVARVFFHALRSWFEEGIYRAIPEPEAGFIAGILVGGDDRLPERVQSDFSRTGISHIVAVSGYNVSIVAAIIMGVCILMGLYRQQAFWLAVGGIVVFTVVVGAPSSAVRAAIMGITALVAMRVGRLGSPINAILLCACVMLLENPLLFRYDIGFQLSFAATLGIVLFSPIAFGSFALSDILITTIAAELFILPIALYYFHAMPTLSLFANMLILPLVPVGMLLGSVAVVISSVLPSIATLVGFPAFLIARTIFVIVDFFAQWEYISFSVPNFGMTAVIVWYVVVFLGIAFLQTRRRRLLIS